MTYSTFKHATIGDFDFWDTPEERYHTGPERDLVTMLIGTFKLKLNIKILTHKTLSAIKLSQPPNRQVLKGTLDQIAKQYSRVRTGSNGLPGEISEGSFKKYQL